MKISQDHFQALRAALTPLDTPEHRRRYRCGDFPRADKVKDLNKRYRWDLFWSIAPDTRREIIPCGIYDDSHIDTALRSIVAAL